MAEVTGFTAARMLEIENETIVDGFVNGSGHLILVTREGTEIDAGDALIAVVDATTSNKGVSELATSAETEALSDATRVITPAGLASTMTAIDARFDIAEAAVVHAISVPTESSGFASYPEGISRMALYTGNPSPAWSVGTGSGTIITYNHDSANRMFQTYHSSAGGTQTPQMWARTYHPSNGGGGWTAWVQIATPADSASMGIVGEIKMWPLVTAPTGWQVCDGSAISRTTYPKLFALLSTTYGAGNGTTTFNVPNMKGRTPVGYDSGQTEFDAIGETGGAKTHTLSTSEIPAHVHAASAGGFTLGGTTGAYAVQTGASYGFGFDANTANAGGGGAHNNLQPYFTTQYIIKLG